MRRPRRGEGAAATSSKRSLAVLLAMVAALATVGCSGFDPDAPWTLSRGPDDESTPIREGTPVIEHDAVPIEARTERIALIEDLVIPGGAEPFYRPIDMDVDVNGNIFVLDAGNQNIVAFDRYGNYYGTIGRAGQGPGELGQGGRITVAGGYLVYVLRNRVNVWSTEGEGLSSRNIAFTNRLFLAGGTEDGGLVGRTRRRRSGRRSRQVIVRTDLEGNHERDYVELPEVRQLMVIQGERGRATGIPMPRPAFAVARSGEVYATAGAEYEVVAFAADGTPRWALRVSWPREPLTDERIDQALRHVMGLDEANDIPSGITNLRRSDVDWPELLPALAGGPSKHMFVVPLQVDGHGHVYVFPFIPDAWDRSDQPVDVYSSDGKHLFSGMIPMLRWDAARGDFVYGISTDPVGEEYRAVRYRLVEPFD